VLTQDGWLGKVDFGGDPAQQLPGMGVLLSVRAAGIYLVPPVVDSEDFPGAGVLGGPTGRRGAVPESSLAPDGPRPPPVPSAGPRFA
jgi:hypothetical protein